MSVYIRLLRYLKNYKLSFALSIFGFLLFALSQPALAKLMQLVIESIEAKDASARYTLPLIAIGIFAVRGVGFFLGNYYNAFVGASVIRGLKSEVFGHMVLLPETYYNSNTQGQLLHRLNSGVERVRETITGALKKLISEGLAVIALLSYAFYLNWFLSLIFLALAPILFLLIRYSAKKFRKISRRNEGALGKAMQVSKEVLSNYSIVRGYGAQDYESNRYRSALNEAFKNQMKIRKVESIVTPISQLIVAGAVAFIVFMLLQPTALESYTTGELIGYLTAISLLPKPLRQLSGVNVTIQRGLIGAELVFKVLDTAPEIDEGNYEAGRATGLVGYRNVSFHYPGTSTNALKNISLDIKPGEHVALVGESGSGKSTLASLLYRAYDPNSGEISLDEVDLKEYKLGDLRNQIAKVDQNIALFDDTIRNNIAYGDNEYTDSEVLDAIKNAYAEDFINKLPKGLETRIGENGVKLSGGQRQRLSIARAFLKNSPILILDEATSALDNESEARVKQALNHVMEKRTTIIIAHRLSTIEKADRVVVMSEGEIKEQGKHEDLLAAGGIYANLHEASNF